MIALTERPLIDNEFKEQCGLFGIVSGIMLVFFGLFTMVKNIISALIVIAFCLALNIYAISAFPWINLLLIVVGLAIIVLGGFLLQSAVLMAVSSELEEASLS